MVVELAAVIAGVNTAASAIKKAAEVGQDLQTVANMITKLGEGEAQIGKMQQSGKLSEAEALQATLAQKQIADHKQQIKDLFILSGNGHLYTQMVNQMNEARKAEHARQAAALRRRKQNLKYLVQFCMFMLGVLIIVPMMIWLIITLAS